MRLLLLALLMACGPTNDEPAAEDADGDGFTADVDCNDGNADVNPDAEEVCDEVDNDCSGEVDDNPTDGRSYYGDVDDDGYFGELDVAIACNIPEGYGFAADDCDDADPASHPGAAEACDGLDNDCDGDLPADENDGDTDGFMACAECDDQRDDVYPGATEVCDERDNDCDNSVDEDATWFADADGDRYGDPATTKTAACDAPPSGYVANDDDCDDTKRAVSPAATEVCDAADTDEDCDGLADDGDDSVSAAGKTTYYTDADGDGYGEEGSAGTGFCDQPAGHSTTRTDCDDTAPAVNPGAAEVTYDGLDNDCSPATKDDDLDGDGYVLASDCDDTNRTVNPAATEVCDAADTDEDCDGLADDDDSSVSSSGKATHYTDADGDGYGDEADVGTLLCDGPPSTATTTGDCDDADTTVNPGATEVCGDGADNDCDGGGVGCGLTGDLSLADADAKLIGEAAGDYLGESAGSGGDVDGDGNDDILVGTRYATAAGSYCGATYVVFGPISGTVDLGSADAVLLGEDDADYSSHTDVGVADGNADGFADVLVGAYGDDDAGAEAGAAYLVEGPVSGDFDLSRSDAKITGGAAYTYAGITTSFIGDVNADGYPDVAVGNVRSTSIFLGPIVGDSTLASADAVWSTDGTSGDPGVRAVAAGDLDADGVDDLLIGLGHAHTAWVVYGPTSGSNSLADADAVLTGSDDMAGYAIAAAGDVNADGYDDIIVGAYLNDTAANNAGAAHLVFGPVSGSSSLSAADVTLSGVSANNYAGRSVAGLGDVNGDGVDDIAIGAPGAGVGGEVYVFFGPVTASASLDTADAILSAETGGDDAGRRVVSAGDVNADGYADILVTATEDDDGGSDAGAAYLILGGPGL